MLSDLALPEPAMPGQPITPAQHAALAEAASPPHWPSLIAVALLSMLATACWPWGFAQ